MAECYVHNIHIYKCLCEIIRTLFLIFAAISLLCFRQSLRGSFCFTHSDKTRTSAFSTLKKMCLRSYRKIMRASGFAFAIYP